MTDSPTVEIIPLGYRIRMGNGDMYDIRKSPLEMQIIMQKASLEWGRSIAARLRGKICECQ